MISKPEKNSKKKQKQEAQSHCDILRQCGGCTIGRTNDKSVLQIDEI